MRYFFSALITCVFITFSFMSFSQDNLPLCTSLKDLKGNEGKQVLVFGELVRHHQLPHHPYVLLLDNNEWIFLGNEDFFAGKPAQTAFILIKGQVRASNPGFQLANFTNKPLPPEVFIDASKPPLVKEPEQVIRAHPFVEKVEKVQAIPTCGSWADIEQNLDRWVVVYGLLSNKGRQKITFRTSHEKPWAQFEMREASHFEKGKNQPGMAIVKFAKANQPPEATLLQRVFPVCETATDFRQHRGQLVAFSGKVKKQGRFRVNRNTWLYIYSLPSGLDIDEVEGKKIRFITRIFHYSVPHFFELPLFFNYLAFGQVGYIKNGLWYEVSD